MRIHSKFKDYYDTALGYGIDETVHWNRETYTYRYPHICGSIEFPRNSLGGYSTYQFNRLNRIDGHVNIEPIVVLFCGKCYPCLLISVFKSNQQSPMFSILCADMDKFTTTIERWGSEILKSRSWTRSPICDRIEMYLTQRVCDDLICDIHFQVNSPVLILHQNDKGNREVTVNPRLQSIEFQTIVDPFTAFQSISMYISGTLASNECNMVQISDEDMKVKRGFNHMSFKNRGKK